MSKTLEQELNENIDRGIEFLDKHFDGWLDKIDINTLNITSCKNCVMGQLIGDYFDTENYIHCDIGDTDFEFDGYSLGFSYEDGWELTKLWRQRITELREAR